MYRRTSRRIVPRRKGDIEGSPEGENEGDMDMNMDMELASLGHGTHNEPGLKKDNFVVVVGGEESTVPKKTNEEQHEVSILMQAPIQKVDDIEQTIKIDFCLMYSYKLKGVKTGRGSSLTLLHEPPSWTPSFQICNLIEERKIIERTFHAIEETEDVYGFENWVLLIEDRVELARFPFDCQLFTLSFSADAKVVPWKAEIQARGPREFVDAPLLEVVLSSESHMWKVRKCDVSVSVGKETPDALSSNSDVDVRFFLDRKSFYYMTNVCLLFFLIVLLSGTVTAFDVKDGLGDRFSFQITLILTGVAFKYVINSLIPKSSRLTFLDMYLLLGFIIMCLMLIKDFILAKWVTSHAAANRADDIASLAMMSLWVLVNAAFFLAARFNLFQMTLEQLQDMEAMGIEVEAIHECEYLTDS